MNITSAAFNRVITKPSDADFTVDLNTEEPLKNIQGAYPVRAPACAEYDAAGICRGHYYKLSLFSPAFDILSRAMYYHGLLPEDGSGIFVRTPATASLFWKLEQAMAIMNVAAAPSFKARCEMTWAVMKQYINYITQNRLSDEDKSITIFYRFPEGMVCTNERFNIDKTGHDPTDNLLMRKHTSTDHWLVPPGTNQNFPDGRYEIDGVIYFEMQVLCDDNISLVEVKANNDDEGLEDMLGFGGLTVGT